MRYEKKAECPIEIQIRIDIANLVPFDQNPKNVFEYADQIGRFETTLESITEPGFVKQWLDHLSPFPKLVAFLKERTWNEKPDFHNLVFGFDYFRQIRDFFLEVVSYSDNYRESLKTGMPISSGGNLASAQMSVNESGKLVISLHHEHELVLGCELLRFRGCVICKNIFWARKLNAETCGKKCSDRLGNLKRKGKERPKDDEDTKAFRKKKKLVQLLRNKPEETRRKGSE